MKFMMSAAAFMLVDAINAPDGSAKRVKKALFKALKKDVLEEVNSSVGEPTQCVAFAKEAIKFASAEAGIAIDNINVGVVLLTMLTVYGCEFEETNASKRHMVELKNMMWNTSDNFGSLRFANRLVRYICSAQICADAKPSDCICNKNKKITEKGKR